MALPLCPSAAHRRPRRRTDVAQTQHIEGSWRRDQQDPLHARHALCIPVATLTYSDLEKPREMGTMKKTVIALAAAAMTARPASGADSKNVRATAVSRAEDQPFERGGGELPDDRADDHVADPVAADRRLGGIADVLLEPPAVRP